MRQHRDAEACDSGIELRDQVGAAELGGNLWRDLRQVIQFRCEQQFLDIADEAMPRQVAAARDGGRAIEIGGGGIEPEAVIEQLAPTARVVVQFVVENVKSVLPVTELVVGTVTLRAPTPVFARVATPIVVAPTCVVAKGGLVSEADWA